MIKFGTDGWRAIIDQDFNEENVSLVSQAIANYLNSTGKKSIVIGYDGRHKADIFAKLSAEIMAANGVKVYLVDKACPTPVTGWSIIDKNADGAIMFTASHNPAKFLGLKYMTEEAMVAPNAVTDVFVKNLANISLNDVKKSDFEALTREHLIEVFDPKPSYLKKLSELVDISKIKNASLRVLVNPMHGAGVGYLKEVLEGGNLFIKEINGNLDPEFHGNSPEPIVENNVLDAIEVVKEKGFDICLSSDGDSDRIGLVNEKGQMLTSLEAFLLLTYYLFELKKVNGPVVKTLSNTVMVNHLGKKYNFEVYDTKVGFKYVGEKMKEVNAVFGGEESGGSAVNNFILVRDAQIMNLFILDLMITLNKPISKVLAIAEEAAGGGYVFRREDVHFSYEGYDKIKDEKTKLLTESSPEEIIGKKITNIRSDDGIKFFFEDDSWLLIRFSGTEPVLRLYSEAKTKEEVDQLLQFAKSYVRNS